jgi:AcrR family transcriptional regulator
MTFTAMARLPTLSDEEIAARTRAVFVECGFGARAKQIAAAVGLTWGAIALRFDSKRSLFTRVMAEPAHPSGHADCERKHWADLPSLLEWLSDHLWECWPLRLQIRLAATADNPCEEWVAHEQKLAEVLEAHARRGSVVRHQPESAGANGSRVGHRRRGATLRGARVDVDEKPSVDPHDGPPPVPHLSLHKERAASALD